MKLEIERADFLKAWQTAEKYTQSKTNMDAINGIRITAKDDIATLEATDKKSSIKCVAKGAAILESGVAVLNAAIFGEMLRKSQAKTLSLTINDDRVTLSSYRSKSRFTLIPVETFPAIPASSEAEEICTIMAKDFGQLINEGCCAASQPSDFPKYLGTCLIRTENENIIAVSTDGKRLARSQTACISVNKQEDILMPAAALKDLIKLFAGEETVTILSDGNLVWFRLDEAEFSVSRIDASFPKYEKILNDELKTSMKVNKSALVQAIERVDIISKTNPAVHIMAMHINPESGELRITARSPECGTTSESLEANIEGAPMQIGYNVNYFMDGLKAVNSDVVLVEFSDDEGQTRIFNEESKDFLYMLMPIRLTPQDILSDDDYDVPEAYEAPQPEESAQEQEAPQEQGQESEAPF